MTEGPMPGAGPVDATRAPRATLKTLGLRAVAIDGGLWARRQAVNREAALPHGFRMLESAGNLENLRIAAGRSAGGYRGPVFTDSDVYKWLEAAAYEIARTPSDWLRATADTTIDLVAAAQGDDGYLNTYYQVAEPGQRWTDFAHGHELYCAGHLFQAAVAHRRATGEDRLLRIARRFADHIDSVFGPGRRVATPGHPEIEMALVELYRETGERRYLDLAAFFVDQRGHGWLGPGRYQSSAYFQDRVPVREATGVEGHAVRALYLTAGVADLYLETGEAALLEALRRQWHDLVSRKLYVTGGVGARHLAEAFGQPYELPSELAYSETCGAIASVMWSWRMLLATGESRFADLIERTLYNAVLGGVSLTGDRYFYVNPLASNGEAEHLSRGGCRRKEWHRVACCPPNVMRLIASLGHYVATCDAGGLQIHQYGSARIAADLASSGAVALRMDSAFPWEGRIRLGIEDGGTAPWTLALRLPGWCPGAPVRINGREAPGAAGPTGYLRLERAWARGDAVELDLAMDARLIEAHPWIEAARGCVAIERGPVVGTMGQARAGRWFLLPGLVFLFAIDLVPLVYSGWVSFYEWWLVRPRDIRFVGLANYLRLAADAEFWRAVVVTSLFTFGAVLLEFLAGLGLALLFAQPFRFLRPIRVLLLLPLFVVPVVGATMWRVIFHPEIGVLNHYLDLVGLGRPPWLSDPTLALVSIAVVDAWRTIPFMFLVIYAGLEVLPAELFEAAAVDGASRWQAFRYITVPLLTYIMLVAVLIRGMDAFREFDIIFVLTGGGPGTATQTIQLLNYRVFGLGHMGQANALGMVTLVLVAAMCFVLMRAILRPGSQAGGPR